jgi:transcriptional regulator with XRE-family HTH domain
MYSIMKDERFLELLGKRISELRKDKNVKQSELARRCEFGNASMSRIESGKANITILNLGKIADALQVEMKEFFH